MHLSFDWYPAELSTSMSDALGLGPRPTREPIPVPVLHIDVKLCLVQPPGAGVTAVTP